MDAFSYLSVLLSIVLGLGLTQLLTAAGRLIRHRDRVHFHWLPAAWAGLLLLIYVQAWWSMYGLRNIREWTFLAFGTVLTQTATLYVMSAVALPEEVEESGIDLGEYFDRQHRWFFAFFLATLAVSVAKDVVLSGALPDRTNLIFHIVLATGCVIGLIVKRRRYQELLVVGFAVAMVAYIADLFTQLR